MVLTRLPSFTHGNLQIHKEKCCLLKLEPHFTAGETEAVLAVTVSSLGIAWPDVTWTPVFHPLVVSWGPGGS